MEHVKLNITVLMPKFVFLPFTTVTSITIERCFMSIDPNLRSSKTTY